MDGRRVMREAPQTRSYSDDANTECECQRREGYPHIIYWHPEKYLASVGDTQPPYANSRPPADEHSHWEPFTGTVYDLSNFMAYRVWEQRPQAELFMQPLFEVAGRRTESAGRRAPVAVCVPRECSGERSTMHSSSVGQLFF